MLFRKRARDRLIKLILVPIDWYVKIKLVVKIRVNARSLQPLRHVNKRQHCWLFNIPNNGLALMISWRRSRALLRNDTRKWERKCRKSWIFVGLSLFNRLLQFDEYRYFWPIYTYTRIKANATNELYTKTKETFHDKLTERIISHRDVPDSGSMRSNNEVTLVNEVILDHFALELARLVRKSV